MATLCVMKELYGLLRKAHKLYNGQVEIVLDDGKDTGADTQREVEDGNQDNEKYLMFNMNITPMDGLYKNATCKFRVSVFTENYPRCPPTVHCLSKVYHPNIDCDNENSDLQPGESNICVNALSEDWQPEMGLDGCVMAVLFLFYHPEIDDALSPVCCDFEDQSEFEEKLQLALRGEKIDGFVFDRLIAIDEKEDKDESEETTQVQDTTESESETENSKPEVDQSQLQTCLQNNCEETDQSQIISFEESKRTERTEVHHIKAWFLKLKEKFLIFAHSKRRKELC